MDVHGHIKHKEQITRTKGVKDKPWTERRQWVIQELNRFLKDIHQYEQLISRARVPELKDLLQQLKQHAKLGVQKIAERIQNLVSVPVMTWGSCAKYGNGCKNSKRGPGTHETFCTMHWWVRTNTASISRTRW